MSNTIKEQKLPKWFNGELYEEGATVRNRFSGEEYELNAMELSMYDFIMGATITAEMGIFNTPRFCQSSSFHLNLIPSLFAKNGTER